MGYREDKGGCEVGVSEVGRLEDKCIHCNGKGFNGLLRCTHCNKSLEEAIEWLRNMYDLLSLKTDEEDVDFSQYVLRDLINEGYTGEALVEEFIFRKSQIRPAIKRMIAESRDHKTYSNAEDFFNELDEGEE